MSKALDASAYAAIADSQRVALPGAVATGAANTNQVIEVTIKLRRKKELPELTGRPAKVMTRDQLAATYGATEEDAGKVISTLAKFGLKPTETDLATRTVTFTGTAADMENAFLVKLLNYSHPDGGYRGRTGYVHIPKELDKIVEGVFGLDNRRVARRKKHLSTHLVNKAEAAGVPASWYTPAQLARHYSFPPTLKEAATLGITVCASGGDDGSSDAITDGLAHVDFPASSPYTLAVGGTTIPRKGGQQPDIVWFEGSGVRNDKDPSGSGGGGVSAILPRPSWQNAIPIKSVNPGAIVGRIIPDIAANADWVASPYLLVVDGQPQPNGGTSAATPLLASLITLINATLKAPNRTGYLTPVLYQPAPGATAGTGTVGATCCTDVTSGGNKTATAGGYNAGPGYDAVSGWGTPIGTTLAKAVAQLPPE